MLDIRGRKAEWTASAPARRDFLRVGAASLIGLSMGDWFRLRAAPSPARSVIQLWMAGGPTQTDTFDPKPNAGEDFTGPLRGSVPTNVPGIQIGELLPLLAKQADKYTIIRSMTHNNNGHETAAYIMQTGTMPTRSWSTRPPAPLWRTKKAERGTPAACRLISRSPIRWADSRKPASWATTTRPSPPAATPIRPASACRAWSRPRA